MGCGAVWFVCLISKKKTLHKLASGWEKIGKDSRWVTRQRAFTNIDILISCSLSSNDSLELEGNVFKQVETTGIY